MKLSILTCLLAPFLVSSTALTYKLSANEKACFYSNVENKGAKIAFYFAVSTTHLGKIKHWLWIGPSWRIFRRRLWGSWTGWQDRYGWAKGATRRLRLHSNQHGRIQILLQQPDEHICWEICGLWDCRTLCHPSTSTILKLYCWLAPFLAGWERRTRLDTFQTRYITWTNICVGGIHFQALGPALDYYKEPEVLPHQRESQFQHG